MAAGKKGLLKIWYDELIDIYGKEQVMAVLLKGGLACATSLVLPTLYTLYSLTNMKPLPEMPKNK